ncbi:MAG: Uma2 family endonuclease [Sphingobacteriaceae bacterium]|nr:MAG: Uma2 family endonuclease [Sphingobacteriaceae bacterium]
MNHILDIPRTAMEVFNMLPEGTLCEVIDNALYMSPSPTTDHQRILGDIFSEIRFFSKKHQSGEVFLSPCDVYLDDALSVVQPDVVFVNIANMGIIKRKGIYGSPNLVVEVLSSNKAYDKGTKFELYQRNAIEEYIMVDADTKEAMSYLLVDGKYELQDRKPAGQVFIKHLSLTVSF